MSGRAAGRRRNDMVQIGELLSAAIGELGMDEAILIERLRIAWPSIAGKIIATHSRPDRVFKRTLFIAVDHPTYAGEVMMMSDRIMKSLDEEMGFTMVKKIKTEIKRIAWGARPRAT